MVGLCVSMPTSGLYRTGSFHLHHAIRLLEPFLQHCTPTHVLPFAGHLDPCCRCSFSSFDHQYLSAPLPSHGRIILSTNQDGPHEQNPPRTGVHPYRKLASHDWHGYCHRSLQQCKSRDRPLCGYSI